MSSELEDATVFANGTNDASLVTDSEETVREASVRSGDSSPFGCRSATGKQHGVARD